MQRSNPSQPAPLHTHYDEISYIKTHVDPILSDLMVKIVNDEPKDIIKFMLAYLKELKAKRAQQNQD